MAGFGNTFKKGIVDYLFRGQTSPLPAACYISLHTGDPGPDGQTANEVSTGGGSNYARQNIGVASGNWTAATTANPSVISNTAVVTFPAAGTNWGTISYVGFWKTVSGTTAADFIGGQDITDQVVNTGNTASFAIGAITHSFTG